MSNRPPRGDSVWLEPVEQFDAVETAGDTGLDDLVRLTARMCNCPVAAVMLLDGEQRVYRAVFGASLVAQPGEETPWEATLSLGDGDGIYEIPDAYLDDGYAATGIAIGARVDGCVLAVGRKLVPGGVRGAAADRREQAGGRGRLWVEWRR